MSVQLWPSAREMISQSTRMEPTGNLLWVHWVGSIRWHGFRGTSNELWTVWAGDASGCDSIMLWMVWAATSIWQYVTFVIICLFKLSVQLFKKIAWFAWHGPWSWLYLLCIYNCINLHILYIYISISCGVICICPTRLKPVWESAEPAADRFNKMNWIDCFGSSNSLKQVALSGFWASSARRGSSRHAAAATGTHGAGPTNGARLGNPSTAGEERALELALKVSEGCYFESFWWRCT